VLKTLVKCHVESLGAQWISRKQCFVLSCRKIFLRFACNKENRDGSTVPFNGQERWRYITFGARSEQLVYEGNGAYWNYTIISACNTSSCSEAHGAVISLYDDFI